MTARRALVRSAAGDRLALWWSRPLAIPIAAALLALALCVFQAVLHNVFMGVTEYDDGVYLGAAMRLVSGAVPYRDYVLPQPPGIIVLMSPLALLGRLLGTRDALIAARVVTILVTALNSGLVSFLVRSRGRTAMALAGGGLALFPLSVAADHTLMLEPYLVCFALIGALYAFGLGEVSRRELLVAGVAFGAAGTIKIWAVFPFIAAAACWAPRWRTHVAPLCAGAGAAFALVCLPFALMAPGTFWHDVFADQLTRHATVVNDRSLASRIAEVTGIRGIPLLADNGVVVAIVVATFLGLLAMGYGSRWRELNRSDGFVLAAATASVGGLLAAPEFYLHYAYFSAPFLTALAGTSLALVRTRRGAFERWWHGRPTWSRLATFLLLGALALGLIFEVGANDRTYLATVVRASNGAVVDPAEAIDSVTPPGSCVVFDEAILAIEANRFTSDVPGCPDVVDPYGMWLADGDGRSPPTPPPYPASFVATWHSYLEAAQYLVLWIPDSDFIPFDGALLAWFDAHYRLVLSAPGSYVYSHDVLTG